MPDEPTKRGRGCLFYALVVVGILLVLLLAGALAGYSMARKLVRNYTESRPADLPAVRLSSEELDRLQERVSNFQQSIRQQREVPPLALSADELNALLVTTPAAGSLSNNIRVRIEGGTLKGDMSFPLEALGLPVFRGRYINGTATFGVELKDGHLRVNVDQLLVKGKSLPKLYMDKIRAQNLAEKINTDPRGSIGLESLQEVRIENGKLLIVPKEAATGQGQHEANPKLDKLVLAGEQLLARKTSEFAKDFPLGYRLIAFGSHGFHPFGAGKTNVRVHSERRNYSLRSDDSTITLSLPDMDLLSPEGEELFTVRDTLIDLPNKAGAQCIINFDSTILLGLADVALSGAMKTAAKEPANIAFDLGNQNNVRVQIKRRTLRSANGMITFGRSPDFSFVTEVEEAAAGGVVILFGLRRFQP